VPPAPSGVLRLSAAEARRAAVAGQLLADPGPRSIAEVIAQLGWLQIDPTAVVERTERLVLFSRLGAYDPAELDRLLAARELFEYRAFILPRSDYALHRPSMRRYLSGTRSRPVYIRGWLQENRAFRDYVLRRLREDGPLPTSAIEDRARTPWTTGGWNDGKSVPMMLESPRSRVRQNELLTITSKVGRLAVGSAAFCDQVGGMRPKAGSRPRTRRKLPETRAP